VAANWRVNGVFADNTCALADDALAPWTRSSCATGFLLATGGTEEALEHQQRAVVGDPLHPGIRISYATCLMAAGQIDEAEKQIRQTLDFDPNFAAGYNYLAIIYTVRGMYREALSYSEKAPSMLLFHWGVRVALLDLTGQKERSENLLAELASSQIPGRAVGIAYFYTVTGNLDQAAVWWEKAIEQRVPLVVHLVSSPLPSPFAKAPIGPDWRN
jgi:tetratricopeptide (TPR) repeat protein